MFCEEKTLFYPDLSQPSLFVRQSKVKRLNYLQSYKIIQRLLPQTRLEQNTYSHFLNAFAVVKERRRSTLSIALSRFHTSNSLTLRCGGRYPLSVNRYSLQSP